MHQNQLDENEENDPSGSFNDLWLSFNFACVN
jgi:hypothetical protein